MHPTILAAQFVYVLKRIEGRKKLQKIVHILQELGAPFPQNFQYSQYGMYSQQLTTEIGHLVKDGLVSEAPAVYCGHSTFLFEPTPQLAELLQSLPIEQKPEWAEVALQLNEMPAQTLEGISTVLFLKRLYTGRGLRDRLLALKPHLKAGADDCIRRTAELKDKYSLSRKPEFA